MIKEELTVAKGKSGAGHIFGLLPHAVRAASAALPAGGYDLGQQLMGVPVMHKQGLDGSGVVVGIIDTGVDDTHPYLAGKLLGRRDYVHDAANPQQFHPHGTHVAGTIAASAPAGEPARYGVAPGARLRDYRVLNSSGYGEDAAVTQAVLDAVADGCHIINMSLGSPEYDEALHAAVKQAVAAGVLVVCAVGNEGAGAKSYPGYFSEVVGVGAVMFATVTGLPMRAYFSNTNDEVDVCTPGCGILSTVPGGGWAEMDGTSMSSPHAAGFYALLRQLGASRLGSEPSEAQLYASGKAFHTVDVGAVGIDAGTGAGFLTAYPVLPAVRTVEMAMHTAGMKVDGVAVQGADANLSAYITWGTGYVPVRAWDKYLGVRTDYDNATDTVKGSRLMLPGSEL
jgi:major intracellular serine protease